MSDGASQVARLLRLVARVGKLELAKPDLVQKVRVDMFQPKRVYLLSSCEGGLCRNSRSPAKQRGRPGPLAIESHVWPCFFIEFPGNQFHIQTMLVLFFSHAARLQLRERISRDPLSLEHALVGSFALYDEDGDEEALINNLKALI